MIIGLGSQMIIVSMRSGKAANERNVAIGMIEEIFESSRIIAAERWQNIYGASKGSGNHHYPFIQIQDGRWVIADGDESININGLDYTRYFTIDNVSRDSNGEVESAYNASNDDPSTQKITAYVSWTNGETISFNEYLTRWMNKVCYQTSWDTGGGGVTACPTTSYDTQNNEADLSGGSIKILPL